MGNLINQVALWTKIVTKFFIKLKKKMKSNSYLIFTFINEIVTCVAHENASLTNHVVSISLCFLEKQSVVFGSYKLLKLCYFQVKSLKLEVDCRTEILKRTLFHKSCWCILVKSWPAIIENGNYKNGSQMLFRIIDDVFTKLRCQNSHKPDF